MKKILILMMFLFLIGCENKESFEIYLVPCEQAGYISSLDDLKLPDAPIMTDEDIVSYSWENHEVVLKDRYLSTLSEPNLETILFECGGSRRFDTIQRDYFVVVVNGEKIYYGNFRTALASSYLNSSTELIDTQDGFYIKLSPISEEVRNDDRVYQVLKNLNLLID